MSSSPVEGGRPLLRARILGFPVHLDLSFVIVMGILGYYPGVTLRELAIWLLITPLAVLVHELGHAVLARAAGARPQIALAGFGGVTTFVPPRPLSRGRSLGISLAGPFVGLAFGAVLIGAWLTLRDGLDYGGWAAIALRTGIWTCVGWSVLNLLPILPLDGGQAMRELLPGAAPVRARRAAMVSVVTAGVAAAVAAFVFHETFLALFMGFFAVSNVLALRDGSARRASGTRGSGAPGNGTPGNGAPPAGPPGREVVELLWRGEPAAAREALASSAASAQVDLAVHGAVLALTGDREQGHALLRQEVARRPGDQDAVALLVLTLVLEHDWDGVLEAVRGPLGPDVPAAVLQRAVDEARGADREDVAGRLALLARPTP